MSNVETTAQYYDRVAETWDETSGTTRQNPRFARRLRSELRRLLAPAAGSGTALELGAGTGPYLDISAALFGNVVAIDISRGMLAMLEKRIALKELKNVTARCLDASRLVGVSHDSVDAVYSVGLIETVADIRQLFSESHRVLKPGGIAVGITSNGACPWYRLRRRLQGGEVHARTGRYATPEALRAIALEIGYAAVETECWGAVPPGLRSRWVGAVLDGFEAAVAPTPLRHRLGVLSFSLRKAATRR